MAFTAFTAYLLRIADGAVRSRVDSTTDGCDWSCSTVAPVPLSTQVDAGRSGSLRVYPKQAVPVLGCGQPRGGIFHASSQHLHKGLIHHGIYLEIYRAPIGTKLDSQESGRCAMFDRRFFARSSLTISMTFTLMLAWGGTSFPASVQDLHPGDRVRIDAPLLGEQAGSALTDSVRSPLPPSGPFLVGRLLAATSDTLVLTAADDTQSTAVPLSQIRHLDVGIQRNHMKAGGGIGLIIGAMAGAAIAHQLEEPEPPCREFICLDFSPPPEVGGAIIGGMFGTMLGAIVGSMVPSMEWRRVDPWVQGTDFRWRPNGDVQLSYTTRF